MEGLVSPLDTLNVVCDISHTREGYPVSAALRSIEQPLQLAKLAYEALRDSILSGHLAPGNIVNEMALAKELGISRTPVREALLELSSQGLVEILPRKGIRIKYFTEQDVHEVCEIRELIELAVVEGMARNRADRSPKRLESALKQQRQAVKNGDVMEFLEADRRFHLSLTGLTDNRRLRRILENLGDLIHVMGTEGLIREGRVAEVLEEHQNVVDSLKQGKIPEAKEAMRLHLKNSRNAILEGLRRDLRERGRKSAN
jgi:DNA-binding GntR family transcriptional regulator